MRFVGNLLLLASILSVAPAFAASGKRAAPAPEAAAPAPAPSKPISQRVTDLEVKLWGLEYRLSELEGGTASISTEEEKYGITRTPYGPFLVLCRSVTPFLDGYKVKLAIGNITSASFSGAKIKIGWGLPFPKEGKADDYARYFKSKKDKEFDVTDFFRSGAYTEVELSISPSTPEEIKQLEVGITLNTVSLR